MTKNKRKKRATRKKKHQTNSRSGQQCIGFADKPLDGNCTFVDDDAYPTCTVHLVVRLHRGVLAAGTVSADEESALEWRRVERGLNLEGRCEDSSCEAFGKWIVRPNKLDAFNLVRDGCIQCPMCFSNVQPLRCGFYDCVWKYEGIQRWDHRLVTSSWKHAIGELVYRFCTFENHIIAEWDSLLIVVRENGPSKDSVDVSYPQRSI